MTLDMLARILFIGAGATLCMDLWALLLKRRFGIPSLDYALVGRWFHATIVTAPPRQGERKIGWILHYAIGIAFAFIPLGLAGIKWYAAPTPIVALLSGWLSLAAPFLVMQPALGFGVAAAKTANPRRARLLSLLTHTVYGLGLLIAARLLAALCA
ncbi:TPA: DUF2938 domain-containing protein [Serratia marcescens]|nr:DUF2938 domain-containing protein [Serratia marcescens]HEJ0405478.1 DUF2938 domain-containing protein [Serratia marcescens]HEJ7312876.1 DUF2938 domain-containing protein [Serratia marcescens]HEJ7316870.1 DUF2938 domain-containing protein [Serratia marcescens]